MLCIAHYAYYVNSQGVLMLLKEKLAFIGANRLFAVLPEIQSKKKAGVVRNPGPSSLVSSSWPRALLPPGGGSRRGLLDILIARRLVLGRKLDLWAFELLLKLIGYIELRSTLLVGEVARLAELREPNTLVVVVALNGDVGLRLDVAAL